MRRGNLAVCEVKSEARRGRVDGLIKALGPWLWPQCSATLADTLCHFSPRCRLTQRQLLIYRAVWATRKSGNALPLSLSHTHRVRTWYCIHTYKHALWSMQHFVQQLAEDNVGWHSYTKRHEREMCTQREQSGHMSDQTVVWVCCPTARHGHCVTGRREKRQGKCGYHRFANASDLCADKQAETHTYSCSTAILSG